MYNLEEIINQEQIELLLKEFKGDEQLSQLKLYLLQFNEELREIGIDAANLAWQIYTLNKK
jgi:hypothetical protein